MDCGCRFKYESASRKKRLDMAERLLCVAYCISIINILELVGIVLYIRILNAAYIILPISLFLCFQFFLIYYLINFSKKIKIFDDSNPEEIKV